MRYFPMFFDSVGKKVLIVGGGEIALQKLSVLSEFEFDIRVIGQKIDIKVQNICIKKGYEFFERPFADGDMDGFDIVIAATDDVALQKRVYELKQMQMLVNSADLPECCDFIFGSMFEKEGILVAISSGSKAPSVSKALKERLKNTIPQGISALVSKIELIRATEKAGKNRMEKIKKLTSDWFEKL